MHPGLRRLARPPGLRRGPGRRVRRPDGGRPLRGRRASGPRSPPPGPRPTSSCAGTRRAGGRDAPAGHHHGRGQVRVRADRRRRGPGARASPAELTPRPPSSARTWCRPSTPTTRPATSTWSTGPMLAACAPHARWVDVFCEHGRLRRRRGRGRCSAAGIGRRPAAAAARQPARARSRGAARRRGRAPPRPTTAPTSTDADVTRCADAGVVATLLPGAEFSTRSPYPPAPAAAGRRRHRRAGHRLQPGLVLHARRCRLRRARGPRDADDAGRGAVGRHRRGRRGAAPGRRRVLRRRAPGPTWWCWTRRPTPTWPTARGCRWCTRSGSPATSREGTSRQGRVGLA